MPLGLNRTDANSSGTSFKNGTPVTLPLNVGNPAPPASFGNPIPSSGTEQNTVTWLPSPSHFGTLIGSLISNGILLENGVDFFSLEDGSGVLILEV